MSRLENFKIDKEDKNFKDLSLNNLEFKNKSVIEKFFVETNLEKLKFIDSEFQQTEFISSNLVFTEFNNCLMEDVVYKNVNLNNCNFMRSRLTSLLLPLLRQHMSILTTPITILVKLHGTRLILPWLTLHKIPMWQQL